MVKRHREQVRCGGCGGAGTGDADMAGEQFPLDMFNWFSLVLKNVEVLPGWQLDVDWDAVRRGQVGHHDEFEQKIHWFLHVQ